MAKYKQRKGENDMDQAKIGRFISSKRKQCSLTQRQLADMLKISDKTISKQNIANYFISDLLQPEDEEWDK